MNEWNLTFVGSDDTLTGSLEGHVGEMNAIVCLRQDTGWLILTEAKPGEHPLTGAQKEHAAGAGGAAVSTTTPPPADKGKGKA